MDRILLSSMLQRNGRTTLLAVAAGVGIAAFAAGLVDPARVIAWASGGSPEQAGLVIAMLAALLMLGLAVLAVLVGRLRRNLRVSAALDNMTQGLCMFDSSARLVLCNEPYLAMYGLTRKQVYPGCHLRDLLELRKANGTFFQDIDKYLAGAERRMVEGKVFNDFVELHGRIISINNRPTPEGAGSRRTRTSPIGVVMSRNATRWPRRSSAAPPWRLRSPCSVHASRPC